MIGSAAAVFSFDAVVASAFSSVDNAALTAHTTVTVTGLNFGRADASVSARFGQPTACATAAWTSSSAMQCRLGRYEDYSGTMLLTVAATAI